jgi:hypothetical protein
MITSHIITKLTNLNTSIVFTLYYTYNVHLAIHKSNLYKASRWKSIPARNINLIQVPALKIIHKEILNYVAYQEITILH